MVERPVCFLAGRNINKMRSQRSRGDGGLAQCPLTQQFASEISPTCSLTSAIFSVHM